MSTDDHGGTSGLFDDPISRLLRTLLDEYGPGDRLPNERDLAQEFGVSRTALRDRMRLLEAVGLVSRRQGAGTFVEKSYNAEGLAFALDLLVTTGQMTIAELHQERIGLERQAAIIAASRSDEDGVTGLRAALATMEEQYGTPDVLAADVDFHRLLMRVRQPGAELLLRRAPRHPHPRHRLQLERLAARGAQGADRRARGDHRRDRGERPARRGDGRRRPVRAAPAHGRRTLKPADARRSRKP